MWAGMFPLVEAMAADGAQQHTAGMVQVGVVLGLITAVIMAALMDTPILLTMRLQSCMRPLLLIVHHHPWF